MQVIATSTELRKEPDYSASLETELLAGTLFEVEGEHHHPLDNSRWYFGRSAFDGYVGWVNSSGLSRIITTPTHRVSVVRTPVYFEPDFKSPRRSMLSMNAQVCVVEEKDEYAKLDHFGWVFKDQLVLAGKQATDFVAEAMKLVGTPYYWGGFDTNHGIDCSAVVQHALFACGITVPRNSGDQQKAIGVACDDLPCERGQLLFWPGHVGIVVSSTELLHASIFCRNVAIEPLEKAIAERGEPTARKRIA
ncbi:MAG TPA: NlpC/P60 family protein [Candidatus Paceibacterota bacterium]|nr:NlpC/P60 family protein [Candidatus Paceibacterota bacterium]